MTAAKETLQVVLDKLLAAAPQAALLVGVLIVGLLLTVITRRVVVWAARRAKLDELASRVGAADLLERMRYQRGVVQLLGQVVFVVGVTLTLAAAAELFGLRAVAAGTSAVVAYLPRVLAGLFCLLGGVLLARFLEALVLRAGERRDDIDSPRFVALLIYYAIVIIAVALAIRQFGLRTWLVDALLVIVVAGAALSLGLVFALSGRAAFQNIVARFYFQRLARPGDRIRFDATDGIIARYTPTAAVLLTERGELIVPCQLLLEQQVEIERAVPEDMSPEPISRDPGDR